MSGLGLTEAGTPEICWHFKTGNWATSIAHHHSAPEASGTMLTDKVEMIWEEKQDTSGTLAGISAAMEVGFPKPKLSLVEFNIAPKVKQ